ncbi:hypothetical protein GCM10027405_29430 [Arthrobacter alkaliphilus]|uniref:Flp pilus assembly protein CpaB n=1 Tax=Arthrobacter alkaliphilus TaxID=369936 RepID=UPI001F23C57F|nr:Flp pilus assembly protein CpaB [Arthrobacter alkaliphilus]
MKSRLLPGAVAVLLAIIGVVLVFNYAQGADERAVKGLDPVEVLVVKQAVPAGTPVEALQASLTTEKIPGSAAAKTALHTLADSAGKVAAVDLVPGEQLLSERLVAPAALKSAGDPKVPAGLQEVSFQVEPQRMVGGRLSPGDHVGVYISMDKGGSDSKPDKETTQVVIHKAVVTAVQRAPQPASGGAASPAPTPTAGATANPQDSVLPTGSLIVTIAVTDVDASKVIFAAEFAKIWLTREPLDAKENPPRIIQRPGVYQ